MWWIPRSRRPARELRHLAECRRRKAAVRPTAGTGDSPFSECCRKGEVVCIEFSRVNERGRGRSCAPRRLARPADTMEVLQRMAHLVRAIGVPGASLGCAGRGAGTVGMADSRAPARHIGRITGRRRRIDAAASPVDARRKVIGPGLQDLPFPPRQTVAVTGKRYRDIATNRPRIARSDDDVHRFRRLWATLPVQEFSPFAIRE